MSYDFEFVILGCGTSTGVPVIGCDCHVCTSTDPRNHRLRCSAVIRAENGATILIDSGPDFRQQALRESITQVDAVLYTHAHADHVMGADDMRVFQFSKKEPTIMFGDENTESSLKRVFSYIFTPSPTYEGGLLARFQYNVVNPGEEFLVKDIPIIPLKLHHGSFPILGYRIGSIAYATDCSEIPEETFPLLEGVETLIIDGLRPRPHPTHMTIDQAVETGRKIGAKKTYLTHMSHDIEYTETMRALPEGAALCYDGLRLKGHVDG